MRDSCILFIIFHKLSSQSQSSFISCFVHTFFHISSNLSSATFMPVLWRICLIYKNNTKKYNSCNSGQHFVKLYSVWLLHIQQSLFAKEYFPTLKVKLQTTSSILNQRRSCLSTSEYYCNESCTKLSVINEVMLVHYFNTREKSNTEDSGKSKCFIKALSQVLFIHSVFAVCSYEHKSDYIIICISQQEYYTQDHQLVQMSRRNY